MTESSPFPPPPPPGPPSTTAGGGRTRAVVAVIAVLGLVGTVAFGALWMTTRGDRDDAMAARDAAVDGQGAEAELNADVNEQLEESRGELADVQADLDEALSSAEDDDADAAADLEDRDAEIDDLTAEVDRLTDENEELRSDLDAAESTPSTTTTAPSTTSTTTTTIAPVPDGPPPVPGEIGERLASLYRPNVLGMGQRRCLGQAVLDDMGSARLDEIMAGDRAGDDADLVAALESAAPGCGIDPSAIFG